MSCALMNFHDVQNEMDYYRKIVKLVENVGVNCNDEWNRRMQTFILRFKNSLTCEGGLQPSNPNYGNVVTTEAMPETTTTTVVSSESPYKKPEATTEKLTTTK